MGIPHTFTAKAYSADMNDNFSYCLNKYFHGGNNLLGKGGVIYIPIIINNNVTTPEIFLNLLGKKAGPSAGIFNTQIPAHDHKLSNNLQTGASIVTTTNVENTTTTFQANTNVPKTTKIYIDGVDKTATIGDPNGKGGTMYSSGAWGINGTTEWDTGKLDLSAIISWTPGVHSIEIKETGNVGGTIIYQSIVNSSY